MVDTEGGVQRRKRDGKRKRERDSKETNAVTLHPGTRAMMNSAATVALGFPTSDSLEEEEGKGQVGLEVGRVEAGTNRKRNCRFKLETWRRRREGGKVSFDVVERRLL